MGKHELIYLESAREDLLEIVAFHARQVGPLSAREAYQAIRERISALGEFPFLGPMHPDRELAAMGYRKLVLSGTYVAVYRMIDEKVVIYRVVNGRTDYPRLLK